jgi:type II secretory pathway component PulF
MNDVPQSSPSIVRRVVAGAALLGIHFVTLILTIVVLRTIVPIYIKLFEDYDVELPVVTQQLIHLSWFVVDYWYLIVFLGMIGDTAVVTLLSVAASKRQWLLSAYSHLWLVAAILFFFGTSVALGLPIYILTDH